MHLIADVYLYPPEEGGWKSPVGHPASPGYSDGETLFVRCPCFVQKNAHDPSAPGHDCIITVGKTQMTPGERRRLPFVFLHNESGGPIKSAGTFYLWDGQFVGEAVVVEP